MTTDKKTITVTWDDQRLHVREGTVAVALWAAVGDDSELNQALAYAAAESRKRGVPYRVHTWPVEETQWRALSVDAHKQGRGL